MTSSAKLVWLLLAARAGERAAVAVSIDEMCASLAMSHRAVIDGIRKLVDVGVVERVRLGRYHSPTLYRVAEHPRFLDVTTR
jgi:hypothetical protein